MFKYVSRAHEIAKNQGLTYLAKHSLRFIKIKYRNILNKNIDTNFNSVTGYFNPDGTISARIIPDGINTINFLPHNTYMENIIFDRAAVVMHIFYPDLMDEFIQYIKNIPIPIGLFISTDTEKKKRKIEEYISKSSLHTIELEIQIVPNRGRDIAPKYIAFRHVYERYDVFLHLHSKKSLHAKQLGSSWRRYLLDCLIGSKDIAVHNLHILSMEKMGLVYPAHHPEIKKLINWGYDFDIAKSLLRRMSIKLNVMNYLEFPSGSMFWARSAAIKPLLDLNLQYTDFPEENGQIDGTLAHAIERIILFIIEKSGHRWARTIISSPTKNAPSLNYEFTPLLGSENTPGIIQKTAFETIPILMTPSVCKATRLNLLLPNVDPSAIFGGIATALKIFDEIASQMDNDLDIRVIVTEARVGPLPDNLKNYSIQTIGNEKPSKRVILDASDRIGKCLDTRMTDIFIATAWWTAANAFKLHDMQKTFFGRAPKVIYLIQDYESNFYGWSSKYALAEYTYYRHDDTFAIINSEELATFFEQNYSFKKRWVLPYTPNDKLNSALKHEKRERILLFYSRPSAHRNCFEAGIDGITLWAKRNPVQSSQWKIYCVGEKFNINTINELSNLKILGKLSLEDYADLLSRSSVGLSLMLSPHPSYPPLEMAYSGMRTITNKYNCKNLSLRSDLITSLEIITPENIADALENEINIAESKMINRITPIRKEIKSLKISAPYFNAKKFSYSIQKDINSIIQN